jgi:hypothetical protein
VREIHTMTIRRTLAKTAFASLLSLTTLGAVVACSKGDGAADDSTSADEYKRGKDASAAAPSSDVDPFDDSLLAATPISAAQAKALFAPGAISAPLGNYVMAQRTRSCNATTGCAAWVRNADVTFAYRTWELWNPGPGWTNQKDCFQFGTASRHAPTGSMALAVIAGGQFNLNLTGPATGAVTCTSVTGASAPCGVFQNDGFGTPSGTHSCQLPNPAGSGSDPTVYPVTVPLYDSGQSQGTALAMNLLVTTRYVYGRSSSKSAADANGSQTEVEYALVGSTTPGETPTLSGGAHACVPLTCAGAGKNCGNIPDGCGGTLSCGACGYPYVCGADNRCAVPPGCNLQPCYAGAQVAYTCCSSGQVTCQNGQGCTCYDACY